MFTGIIRELGTVRDREASADGVRLTLSRPDSFVNLRVGDSVAVQGVCLTVVVCDTSTWQVRLMQETLATTNLGTLLPGAPVNLERAVVAGERFDGHFVQGHVDGVGEVLRIDEVGQDRVLHLRPPQAFFSFFVPKGSVAVNGVSLTIVDVLPDSFTTSCMPYTLEHTTLGSVRVGNLLNIEIDMMVKHLKVLLEQMLKISA